jgi:hypothetical protein
MPITYYDPNRPQQRQYEFILQMLGNFAMQRAAQKARKEEAETQHTRTQNLAATQLILTGQAKEAEAERGSVKVGDKQLVRTPPSFTNITVAGTPAIMTSDGKVQFAPATKQPASIRQEWEQYKRERPSATIDDFYKARRQPGSTTNVYTGEMTKSTKTSVEGKYLAGKEQIARMQAIKAEFRPEYLEVGTRAKHAWTGAKARLGYKPSPEDRASLVGYTKFRRKAQENINLYIKEMTGAQMSELEARRLKLAQPDPGDKWYTGADPITFEAKMNDVIEFTEAANQRYEYYLKQGLTHKQIQTMVNENRAVSLDSIVAERRKLKARTI